METKRRLRGFARRLFFCVVIMASSVALGNQSASQSAKPVKYELKIEGESIERLILQSGGKKQIFKNPGESIMLESGTYKVLELHLKGGFAHFVTQNSQRLEPIKAGPGGPAIFKAGGPLEQRIKVQRKGQLLTMDYELIGAGGEKYRFESMHRPTFTIYKGDTEIDSGKFEFG